MMPAVLLSCVLAAGPAPDETLPQPAEEGLAALRQLVQQGVEGGALEFIPRSQSGESRMGLLDEKKLQQILSQNQNLLTPAMCDALVTTSQAMDQSVLLEAVAKFKQEKKLLAFAALARAKSLQSEGNYPSAVKHYEAAAKQFAAIRFHAWQTSALSYWAVALEDQGAFRDALAKHREALEVVERQFGPNQQKVAGILRNIGLAHRRLGQPKEALHSLEHALEILIHLPSPPAGDIADTYKAMGNVWLDQHDTEAGLRAFQKAVDFAKQIPNAKERPSRLGTAYADLGVAHLNRKEYAPARENFDRSLEELQRFHKGPNDRTATVLGLLGALSHEQGEQRQSLDYLTKSLQMRIDLHGPRHWEVVFGFQQLASAQLNFGNRTLALKYYENAKDIAGILGGPKHTAVAESWGGLAEVAFSLGDYHQAREWATQEESLWRMSQETHRGKWAHSLNRLGKIYLRLGQIPNAREMFQAALAQWENLKRPEDIAHGWHNIGVCFSHLRHFPEAKKALTRALSIWEEMQPRNELEIATSLNSLGALEYDQGHYAEARDLHHKAWELLRSSQKASPALRAVTLNNLGMAYYGLRDYRRAVEVFDETVFHLRTRPRDRAPALDSPQVIYGFAPEDLVPDRLTVQVLEQRGMAMWHNLPEKPRFQDWSPVSYSFLSAISVLENLKSQVLTSEDSRWEAGEKYSDLYAMLAGCYDRMRKLPGASERAKADQAELIFRTAEISSGRALLLMLARSRANVLAGLPQAIQDQNRNLTDQLQQVERHLLKEQSRPALERDFERIDQLTANRNRLQSQLDEWEKTTDQQFPQRAKWQSPATCSWAEAKACFKKNEVALLYIAGTAWSYLVLIDPHQADPVASVEMFQLPGRAEMEDLVATVTAPAFLNRRAGQRGVLEETYDMLLGPVADRLQGKDLLIVPSGPLWQLPFAMLVEGEEDATGDPIYLGQRHTIRYAPSLSVLRLIRTWQEKRERPQTSLWAMGDPVYQSTDPRLPQPERISSTSESVMERYASIARELPRHRLPETTRELEQIAAQLNVPRENLHLGLKARESRVKAASRTGDLQNARYVHFATHGILGGDMGLQPSLIFNLIGNHTEDGFLQLDEVMQLKLNADLVVLSACQTGRGRLYRGEGVRGLAQAFLHAGSQAVLCSLWNIPDRATAELMAEFYRELDQGQSPAVALQAAQQKMRPHHGLAVWAPFIVIGE